MNTAIDIEEYLEKCTCEPFGKKSTVVIDGREKIFEKGSPMPARVESMPGKVLPVLRCVCCGKLR